MPPKVSEVAPDFEALYCDGEQFRTKEVSTVIGEHGIVLVFFGFVYSAIAQNWWKHFDRIGWGENTEIPVVGISRDGPYSQNKFIREIESPFHFFSDVNGNGIDAYGLLTNRAGMGDVSTARRAVYVINSDREVESRWIAESWTERVPVSELEESINELALD